MLQHHWKLRLPGIGILTREVVATTFDKEHLAAKLGLKLLKRAQIGGNVFADCSMWTATGLYRLDSFGRKGSVFDQELLILPSKDIVGHDS